MADRDASMQIDALTATGCAVVTDNAYRMIRSMRPRPGTRAWYRWASPHQEHPGRPL